MINKSVVRASLLAAALGMGSSAWAQNAYMTLAGGLSSWNFSCSGTTSCDNRTPTLKFLGGYKFNEYLGVEGGYFSMSRASASFSPTSKTEYKATGKATGFELVGVGRLAFDKTWGAYAKVGVSAGKGMMYNVNPVAKTSVATDDNSVQPLLGLGLTYKLNNSFLTRMEWETRKVTFPGSKPTISSFNLGIQYGF